MYSEKLSEIQGNLEKNLIKNENKCKTMTNFDKNKYGISNNESKINEIFENY